MEGKGKQIAKPLQTSSAKSSRYRIMKLVFATVQRNPNLAPLGSFMSLFSFDSSSYFQTWTPAAATRCHFDHSCTGTDPHNPSQPCRNPPVFLQSQPGRMQGTKLLLRAQSSPVDTWAQWGSVSARHLPAQRGKPVFTLFCGFTLMSMVTTGKKLCLHYHEIQTDFKA